MELLGDVSVKGTGLHLELLNTYLVASAPALEPLVMYGTAK